MSITFTLAHRADDGGIVHGTRCPICVGFLARLAELDHNGTDWDACFDAYEAHQASPVCPGHLDLNLSNTNAAAVLERLGLDPTQPWGEIDPDDLLGRAMVGNVGRDDTGTAAVESRGELGCAVIDCGVRSGYFDDRLAALAALAQAAKAQGALVGWS